MTDPEYLRKMAEQARFSVGHTPEGREHCERLEKIASCISDVTNKVRVIHETMKRGPATVDHGLAGNLACILDHASSKNDPEPL